MDPNPITEHQPHKRATEAHRTRRFIIVGDLRGLRGSLVHTARWNTNTRHLWAVIFVTLALLTLILLDIGGPLTLLLAVPLTLLLPGYALVAASFPGQNLGASERLLASLGLSLALTSLGGLALSWAGLGLKPTPWALLLGGLTMLGCMVALLRRRRNQPVLAAHMSGALGLGTMQAMLLMLAALLGAGALLVAHSSAQQVRGAPFTQLWVVPTADRGMLRVGVLSAEKTALSYRVELNAGTIFFERWPRVTLAPGERWEALLAVPPSQSIELRLYRHDDPETVYRRVTLERAASTQE